MVNLLHDESTCSNVRDGARQSQRGRYIDESGKGKSSDFMLSQALAYRVVQKGLCGGFILCGLSPPVLPNRKKAHGYTF